MISVKDGIKTTYLYFKDEYGIPDLNLLTQEETKDVNGFTVIIPIKNGNIYSFETAIKKQLNLIPNLYVDSDVSYFDDFNKGKIIKHDLFQFKSNWNHNELNLNIEGIIYSINWEQLGMSRITIPVSVNFSIGELQPTPSRESVEYTIHSIELIKFKINTVLDFLKQQALDKYEYLEDYTFTTSQNINNIELFFGGHPINFYVGELNTLHSRFGKIKGLHGYDISDLWNVFNIFYYTKSKGISNTGFLAKPSQWGSESISKRKSFIIDDVDGKLTKEKSKFIHNHSDVWNGDKLLIASRANVCNYKLIRQTFKLLAPDDSIDYRELMNNIIHALDTIIISSSNIYRYSDIENMTEFADYKKSLKIVEEEVTHEFRKPDRSLMNIEEMEVSISHTKTCWELTRVPKDTIENHFEGKVCLVYDKEVDDFEKTQDMFLSICNCKSNIVIIKAAKRNVDLLLKLENVMTIREFDIKNHKNLITKLTRDYIYTSLQENYSNFKILNFLHKGLYKDFIYLNEGKRINSYGVDMIKLLQESNSLDNKLMSKFNALTVYMDKLKLLNDLVYFESYNPRQNSNVKSLIKLIKLTSSCLNLELDINYNAIYNYYKR